MRIKISDVDNNIIEHQAIGNNLSVKDPGSRGKTDSKGVMINKEVDQTDLPQLNSAHLLADWFKGTGYRQGLNLILTSEKYNTKTMQKAEKDVANEILEIEEDYPGQKITFDLHVTANYQVTDTDGIITTLQKINSYEDNQLDEIHRDLSGRQDPCRCLSVNYRVKKVRVDGIEVPHQIQIDPIGLDKDLKDFF